MSKPIIPSFLRLLGLLVQAFHLDDGVEASRGDDGQNAPESLGGRGKFQACLTGRRIDLSDTNLDNLLLTFSEALLRAKMFPALRTMARVEVPQEPSERLQGYLGAAATLPRPTGNVAQSMARRLKWLLRAMENLLAQPRAQEAAALFESRYALQPLVRFLGHHLTVALAMLHTDGHLDLEKLPCTLETLWAKEVPDLTPLSKACAELGLSQADVIKRLQDERRVADDKTVANLWHGGNDHPRLETLCVVISALYPNQTGQQETALPAWRRWYGLRFLAHRMAELWGWEDVGGMGWDVIFGALHGAGLLTYSELSSKDRKTVAAYGIWAGWHLGWARWMFDNALQRANSKLSPIVRNDYLAIARGREGLRLQQCLQIASGGSDIEAQLRRSGRSDEQARFEARKVIQGLQSDIPELIGMDPLYDFHHAMAHNDLGRAEAAARTLVERRPEILGNHISLITVLQVRSHFDEALAALGNATERHGNVPWLRRQLAQVLMARGDVNASFTDFTAARDVLRDPLFHADWGAQLDLADCHFALGDWTATQAACDRVAELHNECGEAFALDSICSLRLGDQKRANQSAEYAVRRGAGPFLAWLREHDLRGGLGSTGIVPPPRWHRMRYS